MDTPNNNQTLPAMPGCAPTAGSQAAGMERIKELITSFPLSDKPKARKLAVNICTMLVTGPSPLVDLFADGERRFLMVDLNVKSPENDPSVAVGRERPSAEA